MLRLALLFLVIALILSVAGFWIAAGTAMEIGKILIVVFLVLAVLSLAGGALRRPPV